MSFKTDEIIEHVNTLHPYEREVLLDDISEKYKINPEDRSIAWLLSQKRNKIKELESEINIYSASMPITRQTVRL